MISVSIFIIMMLVLNLLLAGTVILLIVVCMEYYAMSTNPAIQSGIIEHVEGDTSQVMSWNMSCLNAGIGFGGIVGGLVISHINVQAITYKCYNWLTRTYCCFNFKEHSLRCN